jgi:hypothetical protein
MRSTLFLIVVIALYLVNTDAETLTCSKAPVPRLPSDGKYHICIASGSPGAPTVPMCTQEEIDIKVSKDFSLALLCKKGNVLNKEAWLITYQGARVVITKTAHVITDTYPKADLVKHLSCATDGFFTVLVLNPNTPPQKIEDMFPLVINCHVSDTLQAQAKQRAVTAIGFLSDAIGAIPHPAAIITALVIKGLIAADNSNMNLSENDRIKFLAVHAVIAQLRIKCNTVDGPKVKTCLEQEFKDLPPGKKTYKIKFASCTGKAGSSDYLQIHSGTDKVVTTNGGGLMTDSPLFKLCSTGQDFQYIDLKFDPSTRFCIKCITRKTLRSDASKGEKCLNNVKRPAQTIDLQCTDPIKLSFLIQTQ